MAIYLIISENEQNHRVRLTHKPFFMGRSNKCHLTVTDSMVSGKHLAIKINSDHRVVIKDLDTTNGTYLNGNKIQESHLYIEDFVQVGKIKMNLDESEMTASELKLHKRDFERTNVTFVRLGATVQGLDDDDDEDEFGVSKQKTLLAKIRKMKEGEQTATVSEAQHEQLENMKEASAPEGDSEANSAKLGPHKRKSSKKSVKKKSTEDEGKTFVGKIKGIFKK